MAEPQIPNKSTGMAIAGRAISADEIDIETPPMPAPADLGLAVRHRAYQPAIHDVDYADLLNLNLRIRELLIRMNEIRVDLSNAKRIHARLEYTYRSHRRKLLIQVTGSSEKAREAYADLMCESELGEVVVAQTIVDELVHMSRDTKTELDGLREMSNNARKQIDVQ